MKSLTALVTPLVLLALGAWLPLEVATAAETAATPAAETAAAPETAPAAPKPPGLGDPGELQEVQIDTGRTVEGSFKLDGQDARQQLVVTGKYSSGQFRDLTGDISYETEPAGIVAIDKSGLVAPLADGTATITAKTAAGPSSSIKVTVERFGNEAAGELSESNRADLYEAGLQQRRLPRQGQRPERLQALAVGLRAHGRLRAPGQGGSRPAAVSGSSRPQLAADQADWRRCRTAAARGWKSTRTLIA